MPLNPPPRFGAALPPQTDMQRIVQLYQAGRHAEAEPLARQLTERFPRHGFGWALLGAALRGQQRHAEALPAIEKAASLAPQDAKLQFTLGNVLRDLGRGEEALARYRQALRLQPDFPEAHYQCGVAQQDLGRPADAEASYRRVLKSQPDHVRAHANLAQALQDLGRLDEAQASSERAIRLEPGNAALHFNLADLLHDRGRLEAAEAACRQALRLDPSFAPAQSLLGTVLQDQGRLDEAVAAYREALALDAGDLVTRSALLFCMNYLGSADPARCLEEARCFGEIAARQADAACTQWDCEPQPQRLRVGLVSGDLREHPVGYFLESVVAHLDPSRIELVGFPTRRHEDALTARIRPRFSHWESLDGLDDAAAARRIHAQKLHLLLDLSGHTAHNRLPVFARRPAPVQASWLAYFASTGIEAMDYLIADPWSLPPGEEPHFTERIWRLPRTRLCFTPPQAAPQVGPLPALSGGPITFGCFNNVAKINDDVVALWCRVLDAVPGSRLLLKAKQFRDEAIVRAVRERFARQGLDTQRLALDGPSPRDEYLAAYGRVDIGLDPFPYPGGTTTAEALWMGVPVLTLAGARFLSRQGASLLANAGLQDWIASDADDYVARAARHAADLDRLAALRAGLRAQALASPVFDAATFAADLADALHGMWRERGPGGQAAVTGPDAAP